MDFPLFLSAELKAKLTVAFGLIQRTAFRLRRK